jgi:FtsH-binding integral membrane protein
MEHVQLRRLAAGGIDQGLRGHMIGIYRTMALGLLLTARVSLAVASTPALVAAIFGTPLK